MYWVAKGDIYSGTFHVTSRFHGTNYKVGSCVVRGGGGGAAAAVAATLRVGGRSAAAAAAAAAPACSGVIP
jgi:hypothetical protein